ncbi:hypothetical protein PGB90_000468 [Kerria lacca]
MTHTSPINKITTIVQWNCGSIRAHRSELDPLIVHHRSEILLLNETWLLPQDIFMVSQYTTMRNDKNDGYGGVAILVKNTTPFTSFKLPPMISNSDAQLSLLTIQTPLEHTLSQSSQSIAHQQIPTTISFNFFPPILLSSVISMHGQSPDRALPQMR